MLPPADVLAYGRHLARVTGIDGPDGESLAAEAWATHADPLWRTVARRRCVDERRKVSGRNGHDRRPLVMFDEPLAVDRDLTWGDVLGADSEGGYLEVETRVDLVAAIGGLSDTNLATLARVYWLGMAFDTVGQSAIARAMREARKGAPKPTRPAPDPPPPRQRVAPEGGTPLTRQQTVVLEHAAQGMTNDQIAAALTVSVNTVKTTIMHARARLDARDKTHAVALAIRAGLI